MSTRFQQVMLAPQVLLGLILTIGLLGVWFVGWMIASATVQSFTGTSGFKQLVFTEDGEPLVSTRPGGNQELLEPIYHTLDGKLVPNSGEIVLLDDYPQEVLATRPDFSEEYASWGMGLIGFAALSPSRTYWYLIPDFQPGGSSYFVGYDVLTRRRIGYFGKRGFTTQAPPSEDRFELPFALLLSGGLEGAGRSQGTLPDHEPQRRYNTLMISGDELLKINLSAQTVAKAPMPGKVIVMGRYTQHLPSKGGAKFEEQARIVVRLPEELQFLDQLGEPLGRLPLPVNLRDKNLWLRSVKPEEIIVESSTANHLAARELTWLSSDGTVLRTATVDIYQRPEDPSDWMVIVVVPIPTLIAAFTPLDAWFKVARGEFPDLWAGILDTVRQFWLPYSLLVLVSLALAIWTYRRHRRYEARGAAAWAVFVLLLGPLGLAAYLVHRSWPVRTACEHCGRTTPRDRTVCLVCAEPFPAPELRGIEVFA